MKRSVAGVTPAMLDAWFGNNEATRRRHYSALAVTDGDKTNVLKNSMAAKNPQTTSKNPQIVRSGSERFATVRRAEEFMGND
ncbi:hypothetical protein OAG56_05450 [Mariniblastus sp.]|nr:hypothetical protein [Mariniblastus sp.]MDB4756800.1 hypothetical protein [Mariniblastus sp.]